MGVCHIILKNTEWKIYPFSVFNNSDFNIYNETTYDLGFLNIIKIFHTYTNFHQSSNRLATTIEGVSVGKLLKSYSISTSNKNINLI